MKYLILLTAFTLLGILGCNRPDLNQQTLVQGTGLAGNIYTYTIDSCEYIGRIVGGNNDILTHKGNCEFCRTRNKNK